MTRKRFAVSGLRDAKVCERFVEKVCDIVEESWDEMSSECVEIVWLMQQRSRLDGRLKTNQTGSRRKVPC